MLKRRTFVTASFATAAAASLPAAGGTALPAASASLAGAAATLPTAGTALAGAAAATSRPATRLAAFAKPRAARNADHAIVYRNDADFSAWPHSNGFWEASNGELLQSFSTGGSSVLSIRSKDRGKTWSTPTPHTFETPGPHEGTAESLAELGPIDYTNRDVFVWSSSPGFGTPEGRPFVRLSKDECRTWSRAYRLPLDGFPSVSANVSQMTRPDGRNLLFLTMVSKDGLAHRPMVYGSVPDGSTWHFLSFITPKDDAYGAANAWLYPRAQMLPGGRIVCTLCIQRDPQGVMWSELHYSDDGAATWQFLSRINDFGAPGSLVRMQDGRFVCVYGYRLPPYGLRACISEDEGQSWGPEIVLRDDGGSRDLGYPNAVEAEPGQIAAIYYFNSKSDAARAGIQANGGARHIARTVFNVD